MNYNKIHVAFGALKKVTGPSLEWQYNEKQILVITGLDLPEYYAVDFCNEGDADTITMTASASGVEIPDQFLLTGKKLVAYIVVVDGESVNTIAQITFPVNTRGKRTDISPEQKEQQQIDSLINALNSGVGRAEAAAEAIQDMDVEAETLAAGSAASVEKTVDPETGAVTLNFGIPKGDKGNPGNPGQDGMTPDFRIGTVETLNPGQSATATITGTPAQPVLNLGIPQGEKGEPGGGSGTSDYTQLSNKPQINGHTLTGNQSAADLGLGTYSKPSGGIPKTDLAQGVQQSLRKADTALQTAPVQSVAGKTGAVNLGAGDVGFNSSEEYNEGTVGEKLSTLNRQLSDVEENRIPELKNAISQLQPAATQSDVGKALIVKTVDTQTGKPTSYEYGEAGGGGGQTDIGLSVVNGQICVSYSV